jgi:hypothetical protein
VTDESPGDQLEWQPAELRVDFGYTTQPRRGYVARAPGRGFYLIWKLEGLWYVAHRDSLEEEVWSDDRGFVTMADAKLVAAAWSVGAGHELTKHDYFESEPTGLRAWIPEDAGIEVLDLDDGGVVAQWSCRCGASATDYGNIGEALAAMRDHWRASVRAAIDASLA